MSNLLILNLDNMYEVIEYYLYGTVRDGIHIWIKKGTNPYGTTSSIRHAQKFLPSEISSEYLLDEGFRYFSREEANLIEVMTQ